MMALGLVRMIPAFACLPHHIVYSTPFLLVACDHLRLVVGLARMRVCTSVRACQPEGQTCTKYQQDDEDPKLTPDSTQHQP